MILACITVVRFLGKLFNKLGSIFKSRNYFFNSLTFTNNQIFRGYCHGVTEYENCIESFKDKIPRGVFPPVNRGLSSSLTLVGQRQRMSLSVNIGVRQRLCLSTA